MLKQITFKQWIKQYQEELTQRGKLARYAKHSAFPNEFMSICDYLDEVDGTDEMECIFYDAWDAYESEMK